MKKRLYAIIAAITLVLVISTVVYAAYAYSFPIYVSDESGIAREYVPVMLGFGAQSLVDSGKISATGTDTNMGGIDYMLASEEVNAVIPSLPANANATLTLYTGFTPLATAFSIILGQGGYFTVNDAAALEIGDNGAVRWSGYIDADTAGTIWEKGDFKLEKDGAGNIAIGILPSHPSTITQSLESGSGQLYSGNLIRTGEHLDDVPAGLVTDATFRLFKTGSPTGTVYAKVYDIDGNELGTLGTITATSLATVLTDYTFSDPVEIPTAMDIRIVIEYTDGNYTNCIGVAQKSPDSTSYGVLSNFNESIGYWTDIATADCTFEFSFEFYPVASLTGSIAADEYEIDVELDSTNFNLYVDGVLTDTELLSGASVSNTSDDWVFYGGGADGSGYINDVEIDVASINKATYAPTSIVHGVTYDTGTVTVTNGDATVVGDATAWTSSMEGSTFISSDGNHYVVDSVTDATHLELSIVYAGGTLGAQSYNMYPCLQNETTADAYVGAITWGSNTNIDISYGTMGVSDSTDVETSGEKGGFTMPDAFMPSTWFASGDNVEDLPFYEMIRNAAVGIYGADPDDLQEGVQTIYFIIIIGMAMAAFLGLVLYTRSALLGLLAMLIILFVGSSATIIPMWIPFVVLLIDIGIMFLYRQVAY